MTPLGKGRGGRGIATLSFFQRPPRPITETLHRDASRENPPLSIKIIVSPAEYKSGGGRERGRGGEGRDKGRGNGNAKAQSHSQESQTRVEFHNLYFVFLRVPSSLPSSPRSDGDDTFNNQRHTIGTIYNNTLELV